ncbi:MAG: AmmeMemoRadiSam system radical SAM enzyme [Actinobacteria bacterium HGW-Actinobacteria-1]|jgi:pyruvate formate lyase activating enzyme|nr:MAG: AmmeMemoRadiSam system radical SAM enzyme [Actinobacteria bacterium HGW-Actinobacteria-1]
MREGLLWEVEGERVHCLLCPHDCRITSGHTGVCGVREARDGVLVPLTYGLVSSAAVDPIEKKPVFHYRPGTKAFSLGSVGCTMRCAHCQNWQISRAAPDDGGLRMLMPEEAVRLARQYGCEGVAFTYNEPIVWIEYVLDAARLAKDAGLYTVMVTNGYITEAGLDTIGEVIDVWRVDVKAFDDRTYRSLCKVRSVQPVLEMAVRAKKTWQMHVEVVTNVIPTINDDEATLRGIAAWIASDLGPDTPWHITRFFPYVELAHLPPTPIGTLKRAVEIGAEEGLHFVFLGNVSDPGGEDTRCPSCGATAVGRDGYLITELNLDDDGGCAGCGRPLGIHV